MIQSSIDLHAKFDFQAKMRTHGYSLSRAHHDTLILGFRQARNLEAALEVCLCVVCKVFHFVFCSLEIGANLRVYV